MTTKTRFRQDRPLKVKGLKKPAEQAKPKPTDLQRLASLLKRFDWHGEPAATERDEAKIKALVKKCDEDEVRRLWAEFAPTSKFPTPFGLKPLKQPKTKETKGKFNDPRQAFARRKELGLPDPSGEVANHDLIATGLARGELLGNPNVHTIAEFVLRGELISYQDVVDALGEAYAARVKSEMERLRATEILSATKRNGVVSQAVRTVKQVEGNTGATDMTKTNSKKTDKTNPTKTARAPRKREGMSCLDAAAKVLSESGKSMKCPAMIEKMASKGYWSSPGGATPAATLYSAILVDIRKEGDESRFVKSGPGEYALRGASKGKSKGTATKAPSKPVDAKKSKKAVKAQGVAGKRQKAATAATGDMAF